MASTYSELKVELIGTGEQTGTWGTTTNNNLSVALGEAITGSADVTFTGADVTLTLTDTNAAQTARNLRLNLTGTSGGARNLILGSGCQIEKLYLVNNGLADAVTVKNTTGTGITVPAGKTMFVYNNGTNVVDAITYLSAIGTGVFDAGTVSAPSITFVGDTNTGIYSPAADTIAFTEGGVESMRINSSGQVGIGTNSPATLLDLNGGTSNMSLRLNNGDNTKSTSIIFATGGTARQEILKPSSTSNLQFRSYATGGAAVGFEFYVANGSTENEAMRITSAGNVGIGTTSPNSLLEIKAGSQNTPNFRIYSTYNSAASSYGIDFYRDTDSGTNLAVAYTKAARTGGNDTGLVFGTSTVPGTVAERMRITSDGRVGIGTTSPTYTLEVATGTSGQQNLANFRTADSTAANNAGLQIFATPSATAASRNVIAVWDADGADASGADYFYIQKVGNSGNVEIAQYSNAAIIFSTNVNTERMRITNAGNVGIGTNSPSATLQVVGNIISGNANGSGVIQVGSNSASQYQYINIGGNTNGDNGWQVGKADTSGSITPSLGFYIYDLKNSTSRMVIGTNGNVGIGTATPDIYSTSFARQFTVSTTTASGYSVGTFAGGSGGAGGVEFGNQTVRQAGIYSLDGSGLALYTNATNSGTSLTERMRITSGGNVGIGTSSPSVRLELSCSQASSTFPVIVNNTSNVATSINGIHFPMSNNSAGAQIYIRSDVSGGDYTMTIANGQNQAIRFCTSATTERMRITGAGLVGIGNNSPTYTLDVTGSIRASTYFYASGANAGDGIYLANGSSNGLISQMSNGSASTVTYIGNQTITTSSDIRIKNNVRPTERNALELLSQWEIVDHNWNDPSDQCENNKNSRGVWTGVIAQQIQPITPWLVNKPLEDENKDGSKNLWLVDFAYSVPLLVKAIQEQQAQIEELKQEVDKLKGV